MATITKAIRDEMDRVAMQAQLLGDKSSIAETDLQQFVALRTEATNITTAWGHAWNKATTLALDLGIVLAKIRLLIFKADGTRDVDGTTEVYSRLVENTLGEALDNLGDSIAVKDGHKTPIEVLRDRVKVARSDYRVNFAVAAEYLVETDPVLAETEVPVVRVVKDKDGAPVVRDGEKVTETVQVKVKDIVAANPAGTTSPTSTPEVLVDAVDAFFEQNTVKKSDGTRKPGFRREDIPPTFGRQPKPKPKPRQKGNGQTAGTQGAQAPSDNVQAPDVLALVRWARQTVQTEVLTLILRMATAASETALGSPGHLAPTPNPVLPGEAREDIEALYAQAGTLLYETGAVLAGADGASLAEKVLPHRWQDPTAEGLAAMLALTQAGESPASETEPEPTTEEVLATLTEPEPEAAPRRRRK